MMFGWPAGVELLLCEGEVSKGSEALTASLVPKLFDVLEAPRTALTTVDKSNSESLPPQSSSQHLEG